MTAERVARIRLAADRMRVCAEAARPGPWWTGDGDPYMVWWGDQALTRRLDAEPESFTEDDWLAWEVRTGQVFHGDAQRDVDAAYVAGMHPNVALGVADWLVYESCKAALGWNGNSDRALAVANAYLGSKETDV